MEGRGSTGGLKVPRLANPWNEYEKNSPMHPMKYRFIPELDIAWGIELHESAACAAFDTTNTSELPMKIDICPICFYHEEGRRKCERSGQFYSEIRRCELYEEVNF